MNGKVLKLGLIEKSRSPVIYSNDLNLEKGGIRGDRCFNKRNRELLLLDSEIIEEFDLEIGELRENIVLQGVDVQSMKKDEELHIGETIIKVTGPCAPCQRMEEIRPGLRKDLEGKRGVLAIVASEGKLSVGDPVTKKSI